MNGWHEDFGDEPGIEEHYSEADKLAYLFQKSDIESETNQIPQKLGSVVCQDGFTMSVQASSFHYCEPRNDQGPYILVEVGFPSEVEPLLMPYVEDETKPTETVYGYVPMTVVEEVIFIHGGRKSQ